MGVHSTRLASAVAVLAKPNSALQRDKLKFISIAPLKEISSQSPSVRRGRAARASLLARMW
jgi:hypothetical protein